jgi:hypothetical protein
VSKILSDRYVRLRKEATCFCGITLQPGWEARRMAGISDDGEFWSHVECGSERCVRLAREDARREFWGTGAATPPATREE